MVGCPEDHSDQYRDSQDRDNHGDNDPGNCSAGTTPWTVPVAGSTSPQLAAGAVPPGRQYPLTVRAPSL
jgi:hypothetical protein